jgi:hypothetical protein
MERVFINELGNRIFMSVTEDDDGVHVVAEGPTTLLEHIWTPKEFLAMMDLYLLLHTTPIELDTI